MRRGTSATVTATCRQRTSSVSRTVPASSTAWNSTTDFGTGTSSPTSPSSRWTSSASARRRSVASCSRTMQSFSGDVAPGVLAHHYCASRAYVRVKVACLASRGGDAAAAEARQLHALALSHLERARVRLVVVGGPPGSGKTTLAGALGEELAAIVLCSDETRKELAAPASGGTGGDESGLYSEEMTARTYSTLLSRAKAALEQGQSVVLDATFTSSSQREAARELASATASELTELRCEAPGGLHRTPHRRAPPARRRPLRCDAGGGTTPRRDGRPVAAGGSDRHLAVAAEGAWRRPRRTRRLGNQRPGNKRPGNKRPGNKRPGARLSFSRMPLPPRGPPGGSPGNRCSGRGCPRVPRGSPRRSARGCRAGRQSRRR